MARWRLRESWVNRGASEAELGWIDTVLDPDVLTIGFARRVPSYKRLTLMLRDPARLKALLTDPERPVQLVVAGKAHPADDGGKRLIQQLVHFADAEDVRHRIVFLPDYDISMATTLYPGCDVWLNNPIRPLEASGTSGMKAALNGALNLSILDGLYVIHHRPVDGTGEILRALAAEGLALKLRSRTELEYEQTPVYSALARGVIAGEDADFVFGLDADEFLRIPSRARLEEALARVPPGVHCALRWETYVPLDPAAGPSVVSTAAVMQGVWQVAGRRTYSTCGCMVVSRGVPHLGPHLHPQGSGRATWP